MSDSLTRFIFDEFNVRGVLVKLKQSSARMIEGHGYPALLGTMLQEAAAINLLLATTLKFEGKISIQLQTPGALKLLFSQTTHDYTFRGVIHHESEDNQPTSFSELTKNGQMAITIEPEKGQRYQGVVALEGNNLAECIEGYFAQSEQLITRLFVFTQGHEVCGLLLQALPDLSSQEDFDHLVTLAETLTSEEIFSLENQDILYRLFHQEMIRNLEDDAVSFACPCSREKMLASIQMLDNAEIEEILEDEGHVSVVCEFCLNQYDFTRIDIKEFLAVQGNETRH
jgi:molecular chaperone Hsp33